MDSLKASEELSAKGATHPRVSLDDINAAIAAEHVFTAGEAIAALVGQPSDAPTYPGSPLSLLTICILVLHNGFTVIGKSAPASPENFDAAKGATFAREDAIRQLWPLMGFALRDRLAHGDFVSQRLDLSRLAEARQAQQLAAGHLGNASNSVASSDDAEWRAQHERERRMDRRGHLVHGAMQAAAELNLKTADDIVAAAKKLDAFVAGDA